MITRAAGEHGMISMWWLCLWQHRAVWKTSRGSSRFSSKVLSIKWEAVTRRLLLTRWRRHITRQCSCYVTPIIFFLWWHLSSWRRHRGFATVSQWLLVQWQRPPNICSSNALLWSRRHLLVIEWAVVTRYIWRWHFRWLRRWRLLKTSLQLCYQVRFHVCSLFNILSVNKH